MPTKAELEQQLAEQATAIKTLSQQAAFNEYMEERIVELEDEDWNWERISSFDSNFEFSRSGLQDIINKARLMFLKNPLIQRAVRVQSHYVFGQGVSISAEDEEVKAVTERFINDPANKAEFSAQHNAVEREKELTTTGNLFFTFHTESTTGRVVVRSIAVDQIEDIISNPEDKKDPWFYKRVWSSIETNFRTGASVHKKRTDYYPDWRFNPTGTDPRPDEIGGAPVHWDIPVYHIKVGGFPNMRFGVPEVYAAMDWATAVKNDLEDYASLRRSLSRFAWQITTKGGTRGINAIKTKFNTTYADGSGDGETNPPPISGSMAITGPETAINPIRTAGAAPSPDEGRRLWLMVSAGSGIPETILAGDADVGNLATAKSLDRPTELQMVNRQELWKQFLEDAVGFAVRKAVAAEDSTITGTIEIDEFTRAEVVKLGGERSHHIEVEFPSILDRNVLERVQAVISAATLGGQVPANTMTHDTLVRLLLMALGVDDPNDEIERLNEETPPDATMTSEARFTQALAELRQLAQQAFESEMDYQQLPLNGTH